MRVRVNISQRERVCEKDRGRGKEREQYKSVVFACKESSEVKKQKKDMLAKKIELSGFGDAQVQVRHNQCVTQSMCEKNFFSQNWLKGE